ncbi:MAG: sigma-70 family RNA polymerase sigma factor [Cytophagaceae bacterium]|jgi:RNA polymerase sigma factor (sigma-70 family)|nr:sigma-70 family RNA polymerase sigma factor [Cytophagaceae bacterium]
MLSERDKKIIEAIQNNHNSTVVSLLYKSSLLKIRKYIIKNGGSYEDADDCFQDALIKLYNIIKEGKYNEDYDVDGFIFTVVRNSWIDIQRKRKKIVTVELSEYSPLLVEDSNNNTIPEKDTFTLFQSIFSQLDHKCQTILTWFMYEKMSLKEISLRMGYSSENVAKTVHYRCKQYLMKLIQSNPSVLNALTK